MPFLGEHFLVENKGEEKSSVGRKDGLNVATVNRA